MITHENKGNQYFSGKKQILVGFLNGFRWEYPPRG